MNGSFPRRVALLGAVSLLPACESLEGLFGERKRPLAGERRSVLRPEPPIAADGEEVGRVSLPPAETITEWPMSGGPPSHSPGHAAIGERLAVAWRSSIGSGTGYRQRITAGPVIADGVVFSVDARGMVTALTLADGRQRWRADTTPEEESAGSLGGGVAVADGTAFVTTSAADLLALDVTNGTIRWRVRLPGAPRGAPTVAGGRVFVATIENQLVGLSVEDGRRLWMHSAAGASATIPLGLPAPAVDGETVVAGFGTGELVAVRTADGRVIWSESLGGVGGVSLADIVGISGLPVIDRGRVIAVGNGNSTIAVDLRSGRRLWERPFGGGNGVAAAGDWVFAVTNGSEVLAIGREDGRISWVVELDPAPATGPRRGDPVRFGPPLVAGGRVLVPSSRGEILLLEPSTGEIAGRVPTGSGISLPIATAEGTIVALADDATLIALR